MGKNDESQKSGGESRKSKNSPKKKTLSVNAQSPTSRPPLLRPKKKSSVLNEKDERPGAESIHGKPSSLKSMAMAKTQPMSSMKLDDLNKPVMLTKKNTEIQAAVDLQNRLQRKVSKNSERRRKQVQMQETTAQNRTQERIDMVDFINRHYKSLQAGVHKQQYTKNEYDTIIYEVSTIFASEKALIDVDPPCIVVGDIHGQFNDLINMFVLLGRPPEFIYVFTGDYVDRGAMSLEVIMLLFAYKSRDFFDQHKILRRFI